MEGAISFEDVSFAYPDGTLALQNMTLEIAPGQKVAFVGRSGAGKTTVFNLLPRLFEVSAGAVRLDGVDIREISLASLRDQIALVSQETLLLAGSVAENIGFGRPEATRDEIEQAGALCCSPWLYICFAKRV